MTGAEQKERTTTYTLFGELPLYQRMALELAMQLTDIVAHSIPKTQHADKGSSNWLWEGEREAFRKLKVASSYGESDVTYNFNSFGYRCPEFSQQSDFRILSAGCSYFFGLGLPQNEVVVEMIRASVERELDQATVLWNLAYPGVSNDFICRTVAVAAPILKPDVVLIGLTMPNRREYVTADQQVMSYVPGNDYRWNNVFKTCAKHFDRLASYADDQRNLAVNLLLLKSALGNYRWLCSLPSVGIYREVSHLLDQERCVGALVESEEPHDFARDMSHPGHTHHATLARRFLARMREAGWLSNRTSSVGKA